MFRLQFLSDPAYLRAHPCTADLLPDYACIYIQYAHTDSFLESEGTEVWIILTKSQLND